MREWAMDINGIDTVFKKASDNLIDAHRGMIFITSFHQSLPLLMFWM
jgi:hypothetical protein